MLRFMPPHLLALAILMIVVVWVMLLRHFRWSTAMQKFVAETLGDDTPENALRNFELAKRRLADHLNNSDLDPHVRQKIEFALEVSTNDPAIGSLQDRQSC